MPRQTESIWEVTDGNKMSALVSGTVSELRPTPNPQEDLSLTTQTLEMEIREKESERSPKLTGLS